MPAGRVQTVNIKSNKYNLKIFGSLSADYPCKDNDTIPNLRWPGGCFADGMWFRKSPLFKSNRIDGYRGDL
jgi:hypothetical protein